MRFDLSSQISLLLSQNTLALARLASLYTPTTPTMINRIKGSQGITKTQKKRRKKVMKISALLYIKKLWTSLFSLALTYTCRDSLGALIYTHNLIQIHSKHIQLQTSLRSEKKLRKSHGNLGKTLPIHKQIIGLLLRKPTHDKSEQESSTIRSFQHQTKHKEG